MCIMHMRVLSHAGNPVSDFSGPREAAFDWLSRATVLEPRPDWDTSAQQAQRSFARENLDGQVTTALDGTSYALDGRSCALTLITRVALRYSNS